MATRSKKKRKPPETVLRDSAQSRKNPGARRGTINWKLLGQVVALVVIAAWIYWPALQGDWLWDDDLQVTDNTNLRSIQGLGKIWFSASTTDYWPLTWTLLWIEWHLWGNEALAYHLCNLALHIINSLLVWRLFNRLGLRLGWLGGLLFVIHPLVVESVAWIAEIKNTFSLLFFLLSLNAWLDAEEGKQSGYWKSVTYYLAAMLAKTSTVMLPPALLLYCWWKRGRVTRQEFQRMIPYGIIAVILGLITVYAQNRGHDNFPVVLGGFVSRSIGAGTALFFYLGKFILPLGLLPIYPQWSLEPPSLLQLLTLPALAGLLLTLIAGRKGWGRHLLFGFGFFVLNLLPVLGLVKMSYLGISRVADHLVYLPLIGLIGLVTAGVKYLQERISPSVHLYGAGLLALVMALLAWESHDYARQFINREALWTYTLEHNPQSWLAHNNLGEVLRKEGRIPEAVEQYEDALAIRQDLSNVHYNLGSVLSEMGRVPEAIDQFQQALQINPDSAEVRNNLGLALMQVGRSTEAIEQYQQAIRIMPDLPNAHSNLGIAEAETGHMAAAIEQFEETLKINPEIAEAHNNLGLVLMQTNRLPEAVQQFEEALRIRPDYTAARDSLAKAQALEGDASPKN